MSISEKILFVIVAVIAIGLIIFEYIMRTRKMQSYDLNKLYDCKEMGESLLNFLGSIYIPIMLLILSYVNKTDKLFALIFSVTIVSILIIILNMRINRYKKQIRHKEKYQK